MPSLKDVLSLPCGAIWLKADLHVHTPGSADYQGTSTPEDIVRVALEKGMNLIAITDHNTASWCDRVIQAAHNTPLTVFPGVEISTHQGHVLSIFNIDTPATKIEDLLIKLNITREQMGLLDVATNYGIVEVCDFIEQASAIAIAAHIDGERGFMNTIAVARERKRAYAAPNLRGVEILDATARDTYQKGIRSGYSRKLACIQSSDCTSATLNRHDIANMASRYTLFKIGERSVSGLKLALIDPDMRIRLVGDEEPVPSRSILAMWVTGGFLNGQVFRFSDNVNCLIGDTGAGKSVALELIRFCLNNPPRVAKIRTEVDRMLGEQLGNLSIVHVILKKDDTYYLVERTWGTPPTPPIVSRLAAAEIESLGDQIDMQLFFPVKAFSQSEIIEYAREPQVRLSLTDDLIDCTTENAKIAALKADLKENAASSIAEKSREQSIRTQLEELPTLLESRQQLDAVLNDPRIKQHQLWYKEKMLLENAFVKLSALESAIQTGRSTLELESPLSQEEAARYPNADLMEQLIAIYIEWQNNLISSSTGLVTAAKSATETSASIKGRWNVRFEKSESEYQKLLAEMDKDGKGLQALSERRQKIVAQISTLEFVKHQLEAEILPRIASLDTARERLLTELQKQRIAITEKRQAKAQELTEKLNGNIRLHISARSNKSQFRFALEQLGKRSGIRNTEYDAISEKFHPIPFVKQLVSMDYDNLVHQTSVDMARFEKLRDFIFQRELVDELYELQLTDVDDEIDVMLQVTAGIYKRIEDLAHGQKCMVILMIALAEGNFPLVVDQPEDALHAPGIELGIVSTLRLRRGIRQCLFATRNANIIVSADAEQILPLKADAIHGEIVGHGCLDSFPQKELVLYHVEGGEDAFNRRQTKYYLRPCI